MAFKTLAQFFDRLKILDFTLSPSQNLITSQTGGGDILTAEIGPRLWGGSITLAPMSHADARVQAGLVAEMMNAGMRFEIADKKNQYPMRDPTGSVNGTRTPAIGAGSSGKTFVISGAAPSYVLSPGDRFSYRIGGKRYFNEVMTARTASAQGVFDALPVMLPIRGSGAAYNGAVVNFKRPALVAQIVPGSVSPFRTTLTHSEGMSFDFVQVLKE